MSYLLDTNVLSELRKGPRADAGVRSWLAEVSSDELFLSVLTLGEIRKGIELLRRRDPASAKALETWLADLSASHAGRILQVNREIADEWGRLNAPDPLPVVDSLLAATATVYRLTLVTRNVKDVQRTGVPLLNPFSAET